MDSQLKIHISKIEVDGLNRFRKTLGDIEGLAESIRKYGLLHPIVVDEFRKETVTGYTHRLIAGRRRLEAVEKLGWKVIPVTVVKLDDLTRGEYEENVQRKEFTPSEMAAIAEKLGERLRKEARERQRVGGRHGRRGSGKLPQALKGRAKDKVAKALGTSRRTLDKIETVAKAAEENPEFKPLVEEMDRTGNVDAAYKELQETTEPDQPRAPEPIEIDFRPSNLNITINDLLWWLGSVESEKLRLCLRGTNCSGFDKVIKITVIKSPV